MTTAVIETAKGTIELELFDQDAPNTVKNFTDLIGKGFYDGLTFHRCIPGFMIQGGCPNSAEGQSGVPGTGGPGYNIKCELEGNPHTHADKGTLSMAHAGRDTGGSQFFITLGATPHLDGNHTVFGQVTSGFDVVESIAKGDRMTKVTVKD